MVEKSCGGMALSVPRWSRANSRLLIFEDCIKHQIELLAELICAEECALGAMQVLDFLTRELIQEECRASGTTTKP
jgi:hypothetical protein